MIYGDNPQKINEREDKLGLKTYSYAPELLSILQSGNLYIYCINNPVTFSDPSGKVISIKLIRAILGATVNVASYVIDTLADNEEITIEGILISAGVGAAAAFEGIRAIVTVGYAIYKAARAYARTGRWENSAAEIASELITVLIGRGCGSFLKVAFGGLETYVLKLAESIVASMMDFMADVIITVSGTIIERATTRSAAIP